MKAPLLSDGRVSKCDIMSRAEVDKSTSGGAEMDELKKSFAALHPV